MERIVNSKFSVPECEWLFVVVCLSMWPCKELVTYPGCTLSSPYDSWDSTSRPHVVTRKRMDGKYCYDFNMCCACDKYQSTRAFLYR